MNTRKLAVAMVVAVAAIRQAAAQEPTVAPEPKQHLVRRVLINVPAMRLEMFEDGQLVKSYGISVGKPATRTPLGTFQIVTKVKNPTWYGPNKEVVKPGRNNPVGTRWIGLDLKGYGIHGTSQPKSIGRAASHGCIRMRNSEVEDLFARIQIGDQVEILYETVMADGTTLRDLYGLLPQLNEPKGYDERQNKRSLSRPRPSEQVAATAQLQAAAGGGEGGGR